MSRTNHLQYVYMSGPMSKGNLLDHVRAAIDASDRVMKAGGYPFIPQLSVLWDIRSPHTYEEWIEMDLAWVERCDCVIRLPGESRGADMETAHAIKCGLPVFYGIEAYLSQKGGN